MEIIIYARSCRICYQQANLLMCTMCYSTNYCIEHAEIFQRVHSSNCHKQFLCLVLDIALVNYFADLLRFTRSLTTYESVIDMYAFVEEHLKANEKYHKNLQHVPFPYRYLYSEYASAPLTLYHGLRHTKLFDSLDVQDSNYVIHIIGAKCYDKHYVRAFEIFLHLLCHIRHLTIVMTDMKIYTGCFDIGVCTDCINNNSKLTIESYSMSFCNYMHSNMYKRSNVIVGFQIDFNDMPTWPETILEIRKQNCPLLLTSISLFEGLENLKVLFTVLNTRLSPLYFGENKFCSLAPRRIVGSDNILYRNKYLVIFSNLY
ncbi:uncharacterized protein LOC105184287 [Harpegnathos saltator]|uniref:uncharacterized protein LOC105184287 n=1 Tax=Harpegnathos saltator TaxID=610380 RepID=UPI000DBEE48D|nr:uncharacterized protein LOC105184287 [Harpegnathos saltator]